MLARLSRGRIIHPTRSGYTLMVRTLRKPAGAKAPAITFLIYDSPHMARHEIRRILVSNIPIGAELVRLRGVALA